MNTRPSNGFRLRRQSSLNSRIQVTRVSLRSAYGLQPKTNEGWIVTCETIAPMKARGFIPFILMILVVACITSPGPAVSAPGSRPTAIHPIPTQDISPTPVPMPTADIPVPTPSTGGFELIGHSPLLQRGMNAAPAIYGTYVYIGSRTDGLHADAGVLVVDISNPANPQVVHQIGPPEEGLVGQTSRELRVWPDQELLLVMNVDCEAVLHDCGQSATPPNINIYDISGTNASLPKLIATYSMGRTPHEMFLWDDPRVDDRALLYLSAWGRAIDNLLGVAIDQFNLFYRNGSSNRLKRHFSSVIR